MEGWFLFWSLFVVLLLLLPLGYGWGYRGWGPPPRPHGRRPEPADTAAEIEARGALARKVRGRTADQWRTVTDVAARLGSPS